MVNINSKSYQSAKNNKQGQVMEQYILAACKHYENQNIARIVKVYEPFKVLKLAKNKSSFTGHFKEHAEPDFMGCLNDGRLIAFESKYTESDRISKSVVSKNQDEALEHYYKLGGVTGVCVGLKDLYAFIPWNVWRDMKSMFGRKYMTRDEVITYQVETPGYIDFLGGNLSV